MDYHGGHRRRGHHRCRRRHHHREHERAGTVSNGQTDDSADELADRNIHVHADCHANPVANVDGDSDSDCEPECERLNDPEAEPDNTEPDADHRPGYCVGHLALRHVLTAHRKRSRQLTRGRS